MKHNTRWIILSLIIAASFIAYVLRTNFNVLSGVISEDLGFTEKQIGYIFFAFTFGYTIFQFPGGILGNKYGPRRVITALAVCWGIFAVITALVPSGGGGGSIALVLGSLIAVRFLVGLSHAPFFPVIGGAAIANWFPQGGWGVPNGLSSTGLTLGAAATAPILLWMSELLGWRGALLVTAPSAFMIAAAWWWYVRDYPKDHHHVSEQELALIDKGRAPETVDEPGAWKLVLRNRDVLLLTLSYFCMNYVFYFFFNWFVYFLTVVKGVPLTQAGILNASLWIMGAVGATLGGFACDWMIRRLGLRWGPTSLCAIGLFGCGLLLYGAAFATNPMLAVVFFCFCFGFTQITEASFWSTVVSVGGKYGAAAGGVMNTGGNAAGMLSSLLVPYTTQWFGWTGSIAIASAFAMSGGVLWFFIRGDRQIATSESADAAQ